MSIGPDLEEVLDEVGTAYTIYKPDSTVITGEYLDADINRQVTKPFIREFFIEAFVPYNTQLAEGDIVEFDIDGRRFLTMNLTPELFENQIIAYGSVLYKCNEKATIQRLTKGGWVDGYKRDRVWADLFTDVDILLTERFFGTGMGIVEPKDFMEYGIIDNQMYVSAYYDIQPLDRIWLSETEFFRVGFVETRKFNSVYSCALTGDTRE